MTAAASTPFRCGHVAVIGRPNVGKSTLTNVLIGERLCITSDRPQTTRHRLLGVASFDNGQILLIDTPGIHRLQKRALNRLMNKAARHAVEGVDVTLLVIEAGRWEVNDRLAFDLLEQAGLPIVLAINKIDRVKEKSRLLPFVADVTRQRAFASVHLVSASQRKGVDHLITGLLSLLPIAMPCFAADAITDRSQRFLAAEYLREQLMRHLGDEMPYSTTVEIIGFDETATLLHIDAVIWVERDSQKAIVIGKQGTMLKEIASKARRRMESVFAHKVFLQTWVRVRAGWSDDEAVLKSLGYEG